MLVRRVFPLFAALWLQIAPMLARLESAASCLARPMALMLQWMAGGAAVSGTLHALSAATGLTITGAAGVLPQSKPITGSNSVALTVRFVIQSEEYGIPKTYTYENLPPGMSRVSSKTDTVQGKPTRSGRYTSRVIGWEKANASGFSAPFSVVWVIQGTPPVIALQPVSQTVETGGSVTFTVAATGEAPLTYQWFKDDLEIAGAGTELTLTQVKISQAGLYRLRVSSPGGVTFSEGATLNVIVPAPPLVTLQPLPQTVTEGTPVSFVVRATGTGQLTYAWLKNDAEINGNATNETFTISSTQLTDTGTYRVRVTDAHGSVLSETAALNVRPHLPPPEIIAQSPDIRVYPGDNARLQVTVTTGGTGVPVTVTWFHDGVPLAPLGPELDLSPAHPATAGRYTAEVVTSAGLTRSRPIAVSVAEFPQLQAVVEADRVRLSFAAIPGREYQLQSSGFRDGEPWILRQSLKPATTPADAVESLETEVRFFRLQVVPLP